MCGKRLTFLYTSPYMYMWNITFQVLRLSRPTFVFNKCSEIVIFTIIVLVGIMLAQRRRRWPSITLCNTRYTGVPLYPGVPCDL